MQITVNINGTDVTREEEPRMFLRVKWSPARACLEGVEIRAEDMDMSGVVSQAPAPAH